jgi:hypothetical protein
MTAPIAVVEVGGDVPWTLGWSLARIALFAPLAVRAYWRA